MADAEDGFALTARELRDDRQMVLSKLARLRSKKLSMLADMDRVTLSRAALAEIELLERPELVTRIADAYRLFAMSVDIVDRVTLPANTDVVFEGAQGILLDETHGFHPYTTWSTTTSRNAFAVMKEAEWSGGHRVIGVTRGYSTRHGQGPFVPWDGVLDEGLMEGEHNGAGDWQGSFRNGPLDAVALQYALEVDQAVDCLAITCLDRISEFCQAARVWEVCTGYNLADNKGLMRRIPLDNLLACDLDKQAEITQLLMGATPELIVLPKSGEKGPLVAFIQGVTGRPVACASWGPTSEDKYWFDID
jgi:adenylosuccinate synthase